MVLGPAQGFTQLKSVFLLPLRVCQEVVLGFETFVLCEAIIHILGGYYHWGICQSADEFPSTQKIWSGQMSTMSRILCDQNAVIS